MQRHVRRIGRYAVEQADDGDDYRDDVRDLVAELAAEQQARDEANQGPVLEPEGRRSG